MQPKIQFVKCVNNRSFHKLAYRVFAPENTETILCLHGLTRNQHDFDGIAPVLASAGFRVITADIIGRGASDWLEHANQYTTTQIWSDIQTLLQHLKCEEFSLFGASYGGLLGIQLSAHACFNIKRLILNDITPTVSKEIIDTVVEYTQKIPCDPSIGELDSIDKIEQDLRARYPSWNLTEEQWRYLAPYNGQLISEDPPRYIPTYDPKTVIGAFAEYEHTKFELWDIWKALTIPVLLLKGADSDMVPDAVVEKMQASHSKFKSVIIPDVGHHPMLWTALEQNAILDWLKQH